MFDSRQFVDHSVLDEVLCIAVYVLSSIALTIFSYHVVEEPGRKYIIKWWRARTERKAQAAD